MAVAVTTLGESLATDCAGEGLGAQVRAHMVHYIAQLGKGLVANAALEMLVHPPSLLIQALHLFEPFSLRDPTLN